MNMEHNFGPAYLSEDIVFGASRPGYKSNSKNVSPASVQEWIAFMRDRGINRVVCLLPKVQLDYYQEDLLDAYRETFGSDNVLHAPVEDFHLSTPENLKSILEFLMESKTAGRKTVVHCSGGIGRTGHILAAWLVHARSCGVHEAIEAVKSAQPPRNPLEAVDNGWASKQDLVELLNGIRYLGGTQ